MLATRTSLAQLLPRLRLPGPVLLMLLVLLRLLRLLVRLLHQQLGLLMRPFTRPLLLQVLSRIRLLLLTPLVLLRLLVLLKQRRLSLLMGPLLLLLLLPGHAWTLGRRSACSSLHMLVLSVLLSPEQAMPTLPS